jgi:predicted GNAT family N-acyltransferase
VKDPRVSVRPATSPEDLATAYAIRHEVFVVEQAVPDELERDELDSAADHLLAVLDGRVVATVRLVVEGDGPFAGLAHLGRLAVHRTARGQGVAAALVRAVEQLASARGLPQVVLTSQVDAIGLYERLGYAAEGPVFDDAGIPHRLMRKHLSDPDDRPGSAAPR